LPVRTSILQALFWCFWIHCIIRNLFRTLSSFLRNLCYKVALSFLRTLSSLKNNSFLGNICSIGRSFDSFLWSLNLTTISCICHDNIGTKFFRNKNTLEIINIDRCRRCGIVLWTAFFRASFFRTVFCVPSFVSRNLSSETQIIIKIFTISIYGSRLGILKTCVWDCKKIQS